MKSVLILILSLIFLLGCGAKQDFSQEINDENLISVDLNNLNINIRLPQIHSLQQFGDKAIINLNPNKRAIKQFSIEKSTSIEKRDKYQESFQFRNGAILKYYKFEEGGGSGGIEYELEGILKLKNEQFLITASHQTELVKGDPEFCLKYLSTIDTY